MKEKTIYALGFFDGVHIGHGALLKMAVRRAQERGCRSAAFTFDRSPREFVTGKPVPLLTTPRPSAVRTTGPCPATARCFTTSDFTQNQTESASVGCGAKQRHSPFPISYTSLKTCSRF